MKKKVFMICGIVLAIIIGCILFFLISSKTINFLAENIKSFGIGNEKITQGNDELSDKYDSNVDEINEETIYDEETDLVAKKMVNTFLWNE